MTACMPSCPVIPTPTSAIWIMLTSLAPSPMASVITLRLSFTSWTTADWNKCNHKDWQLNENHNKGERSLGATKLLSSRAKINALFQLSVGHYKLFLAAKENGRGRGRGRGRDANKSNVWTPTFCIGAARQHNTTWHLLARSKNLVLRDSSNAYINVRPSMTRPKHWSVGWPMLPDTVQEELLLTLLAAEWMWANQDEIWPRHSSCGRKALFWLSCTTSRYYKALWENFPGYKFQVPDRKWYLKLVWKLFKTRTNKQTAALNAILSKEKRTYLRLGVQDDFLNAIVQKFACVRNIFCSFLKTKTHFYMFRSMSTFFNHTKNDLVFRTFHKGSTAFLPFRNILSAWGGKWYRDYVMYIILLFTAWSHILHVSRSWSLSETF